MTDRELQQLRNDGYDDAANEIDRLRAALRQMYDAFWGTSESRGQDEANDAAKALLDEFDA